MTTINGKACVANGRNLLLDTDFNNLDLWYANQYWTKQPDKYNGLAVMQTTASWNGLSQYVKVKTGEVYTFSIYARYTSGTGTSNIYWLLNGNPESGHAMAQASPNYKQVNLSDSWQRISTTTTITADGYIRPRIERTSDNSNVLQIAGMKLETGKLATPLTPVPVDKVFSDGGQVYGRNLLLGTSSVKARNPTWENIINVDVTNLVGTILNYSEILDITDSTQGTVKVFLVLKDSSGKSIGDSAWSKDIPFGKADKAIATITIPTGASNLMINERTNNTNFNPRVGSRKLEKGTIATDWTPAPEDVM